MGSDQDPVKAESTRLPARTQRWAAVGYAIPFVAFVIPVYFALAHALGESDSQMILDVLDRLGKFSNGYGLYAVGAVITGGVAIKAVGKIADAIKALKT